MTGEQFVKLCYEEKEAVLKEYFDTNPQSEVAIKICKLTESGVNKETLYELINLVLNENYYTLLLALDGEASLNGVQNCYKIFDENNNLLNECGELEAAAFEYFMEKN